MEYTLDELVAAVASRLAAAGLDRQFNGQVSAFPDRRTLRYYTTIGLMDRPDSVRDRQAIYSDRHIAQAVAVKRLQASGLALAAIQARLTGMPPAAVEALAGDRPDAPPTGGERRFWAPPSAPSAPSPPSAPAPWTPAPSISAPSISAAAAAGSALCAGAALAAADGAAGARTSPAHPSTGQPFGIMATPPVAPSADMHAGARPMLAITLGGTATLLLDTDRRLTGPDIAGIRAAAAALLDHLDRLDDHPDHLAAAPASLGPTGAAPDRKDHP